MIHGTARLYERSIFAEGVENVPDYSASHRSMYHQPQYHGPFHHKLRAMFITSLRSEGMQDVCLSSNIYSSPRCMEWMTRDLMTLVHMNQFFFQFQHWGGPGQLYSDLVDHRSFPLHHDPFTRQIQAVNRPLLWSRGRLALHASSWSVMSDGVIQNTENA